MSLWRSLNVDDLFHSEFIDAILHHAVQEEHFPARFAQVGVLCVSQGLDDQSFILAVRLWDEEANDASGGGQLADNLGVLRASQDWHVWPVLSNIPRQ